ncbi:MAG: hypothetical protein ABW051_02695 [Burkholderiaceae bacterium]
MSIINSSKRVGRPPTPRASTTSLGFQEEAEGGGGNKPRVRSVSENLRRQRNLDARRAARKALRTSPGADAKNTAQRLRPNDAKSPGGAKALLEKKRFQQIVYANLSAVIAARGAGVAGAPVPMPELWVLMNVGCLLDQLFGVHAWRDARSAYAGLREQFPELVERLHALMTERAQLVGKQPGGWREDEPILRDRIQYLRYALDRVHDAMKAFEKNYARPSECSLYEAPRDAHLTYLDARREMLAEFEANPSSRSASAAASRCRKAEALVARFFASRDEQGEAVEAPGSVPRSFGSLYGGAGDFVAASRHPVEVIAREIAGKTAELVSAREAGALHDISRLTRELRILHAEQEEAQARHAAFMKSEDRLDPFGEQPREVVKKSRDGLLQFLGNLPALPSNFVGLLNQAGLGIQFAGPGLGPLAFFTLPIMLKSIQQCWRSSHFKIKDCRDAKKGINDQLVKICLALQRDDLPAESKACLKCFATQYAMLYHRVHVLEHYAKVLRGYSLGSAGLGVPGVAVGASAITAGVASGGWAFIPVVALGLLYCSSAVACLWTVDEWMEVDKRMQLLASRAGAEGQDFLRDMLLGEAGPEMSEVLTGKVDSKNPQAKLARKAASGVSMDRLAQDAALANEYLAQNLSGHAFATAGASNEDGQPGGACIAQITLEAMGVPPDVIGGMLASAAHMGPEENLEWMRKCMSLISGIDVLPADKLADHETDVHVLLARLDDAKARDIFPARLLDVFEKSEHLPWHEFLESVAPDADWMMASLQAVKHGLWLDHGIGHTELLRIFEYAIDAGDAHGQAPLPVPLTPRLLEALVYSSQLQPGAVPQPAAAGLPTPMPLLLGDFKNICRKMGEQRKNPAPHFESKDARRAYTPVRLMLKMRENKLATPEGVLAWLDDTSVTQARRNKRADELLENLLRLGEPEAPGRRWVPGRYNGDVRAYLTDVLDGLVRQAQAAVEGLSDADRTTSERAQARMRGQVAVLACLQRRLAEWPRVREEPGGARVARARRHSLPGRTPSILGAPHRPMEKRTPVVVTAPVSPADALPGPADAQDEPFIPLMSDLQLVARLPARYTDRVIEAQEGRDGKIEFRLRGDAPGLFRTFDPSAV